MLVAAEFAHRGDVRLEIIGDAIENCDFVEGAMQATLGRPAIVSNNIEDQGIVALSRCIECSDQSPDLRIGMCSKSGENLHHMRVEALLVGAKTVPRG